MQDSSEVLEARAIVVRQDKEMAAKRAEAKKWEKNNKVIEPSTKTEDKRKAAHGRRKQLAQRRRNVGKDGFAASIATHREAARSNHPKIREIEKERKSAMRKALREAREALGDRVDLVAVRKRKHIAKRLKWLGLVLLMVSGCSYREPPLVHRGPLGYPASWERGYCCARQNICGSPRNSLSSLP